MISLPSSTFLKLCRRLEEAAICRSDNVASCRSLQDVISSAYFEDNLREAIEACQNSTDIDLTPPTDVYTTSANCITNFMDEINVALMADDVAEPVCSAITAFEDCPKELPPLTMEFILGDMIDMVNAIAPVCDVLQQTGAGESSSASFLAFSPEYDCSQ